MPTKINEEDEAFMRNVRYFWEKNGDPDFVGFNHARCMQLMPEFYAAWSNYKLWRNMVEMTLKDVL